PGPHGRRGLCPAVGWRAPLRKRTGEDELRNATASTRRIGKPLSFPSSCLLGGRRERIEARAATVGVVERHAEMARTRIADLQRNLRHVQSSFAQQFGGSFHAQLAQMLENRLPCFL